MSVRTPRLTLLGPAWSRTFRCLWMLEELNLEYKLVDDEARPWSPKVLEHQASGKVPILLEVDEGDDNPSFVLSESVAITTYLGDRYDKKDDDDERLVPRTGARRRALYDQTVCCILSELDAQGLWIARKHDALGKKFGTIPEAVEAARKQFLRMNAIIAKQINDGEYLLGKQFTAADIIYIHCLDWAMSRSWHLQDNDKPHEEWPAHLDAYIAACHARPTYKKCNEIRQQSLEGLRESNPSLL